ncbi:MAG: hypothetical protein Q9207_007278 [Kuettlingeria erythrocarpa]
MEAFALIGLASNIVQFLEFSGRLISASSELYGAANGALSSNSVLEQITTDLKQHCDGLLPSTMASNGPARTDPEAALLLLGRSCRDLGQEFLVILEDLKVKGNRKRWQSARQALRTAWKAKDIQKYERQLGLYRSQIATRLLEILGHKLDRTNTMQCRLAGDVTSVKEALDRLNDDHRRLGISAANEAAELRKTVIKTLERATSSCDTRSQMDVAEPQNLNQLPSDMFLWLSKMSSAGALLSKQISIIDSLYFPQILQREENIKEAHPTTFEWLFESPCPTNDPEKPGDILNWLRSGCGAFWVNGRAGSGKSTLMKFFYQHPKTTAALKEWSGSRSLFVASFFSWNAGTVMQKSQQGLLQTLLYHIFRQDTALIASLCPSRWNQTSPLRNAWSYSEVSEAFTKLKGQNLDSVRLCFFIDGLDEFDGDHLDIINTIDMLTLSGAIKVCFSSRPWTVFKTSYGTNHGLMIRLQDLTRSDIMRFVEDRLAEGTQFVKLKNTNQAYEDLVREILERSNGVFLWVYLVVRSLRRGMTNYDTVSELQTRLRELPVELEKYFQYMLDSTERIYHQQAARLYLVRLVAAKAPTVLDVSMFAEENMHFALTVEQIFGSGYDHPTYIERTKHRILARCQDLLEFDCDSGLQFLHRTVKSFLETRDMRKLLDRRAGTDFNPHRFICNSVLVGMKLIDESLLLNEFNLHRSITVLFDEEGIAELPWQPIAQTDFFRSALCTFFHHAHSMEVDKLLDYRLFPLLDRIYWDYSRASSCAAHDPCWGFHHEGWLADQAAENGVLGFLPHHIDTWVQVLSTDGHPTRKPPLDVALRSMRSTQKYGIVKRVLDAGADPNEAMPSIDGSKEKTTVWQAYVCAPPLMIEDDPGAHDTLHLSKRKTDPDILELLLNRGAHPNIGAHLPNTNSSSELCTRPAKRPLEVDTLPSEATRRLSRKLRK